MHSFPHRAYISLTHRQQASNEVIQLLMAVSVTREKEPVVIECKGEEDMLLTGLTGRPPRR